MCNWHQLQFVWESINTNRIIYLFIFIYYSNGGSKTHRDKSDFITFFPFQFKILPYSMVVETNIPFKDNFSSPNNPKEAAIQSNFLSPNQ